MNESNDFFTQAGKLFFLWKANVWKRDVCWFQKVSYIAVGAITFSVCVAAIWAAWIARRFFVEEWSK